LRGPRQDFAPNGDRKNEIRIGKIEFINPRCAKHRVRISPQRPDQLTQGMKGTHPDMPHLRQGLRNHGGWHCVFTGIGHYEQIWIYAVAQDDKHYIEANP